VGMGVGVCVGGTIKPKTAAKSHNLNQHCRLCCNVEVLLQISGGYL